MSMLADRIQSNLVAAMKSRDEATLSVLRMLKSSIQKAETEKGREGGLSDDDVLALIRRAVKQREEAAEAYRAVKAQERADAELQEARILTAYLPAQLEDEELEPLIREIVVSSGASGMKDMGRVMALAVKAVEGRADGRRVKAAVTNMLQAGS